MNRVEIAKRAIFACLERGPGVTEGLGRLLAGVYGEDSGRRGRCPDFLADLTDLLYDVLVCAVRVAFRCYYPNLLGEADSQAVLYLAADFALPVAANGFDPSECGEQGLVPCFLNYLSRAAAWELDRAFQEMRPKEVLLATSAEEGEEEGVRLPGLPLRPGGQDQGVAGQVADRETVGAIARYLSGLTRRLSVHVEAVGGALQDFRRRLGQPPLADAELRSEVLWYVFTGEHQEPQVVGAVMGRCCRNRRTLDVHNHRVRNAVRAEIARESGGAPGS